jgi:hypothetical protein
MAQIALPRHQASQSQSGTIGSPLYQRRQPSNAGPIELLPNPDFSFPMRGPDTSSSEPTPTSSRPMSLQAYPTGRRGSMPHQRQKSVSALPAFSFNPAGATQPSNGTSPPHSPSTLPTTPAKPIQGGHRRGGRRRRATWFYAADEQQPNQRRWCSPTTDCTPPRSTSWSSRARSSSFRCYFLPRSHLDYEPTSAYSCRKRAFYTFRRQ